MNDQLDELLDRNIDALLEGSDRWDDSPSNSLESLAYELLRVAAEDTPRLSAVSRSRGLVQLRASAAKKRRNSRPNALWFLFTVPHWAQAAAAVIILGIALTGVTRASADALPGAPLYGVKRFTEGSQLLIESSPGERARLSLDFANRRLDELQRVIANKQSVDPAALDAIDESILRALNEIIATKGAERVTLLQAVTDLATRQQQIVDTFGARAEPDERPRFAQTSKLLAGVASIATAAQSNGAVGPEIVPSVSEPNTPTSAPTVSDTPTRTLTPMPTDTPTLTTSPPRDTDIAPHNDNNETNGQVQSTPPSNNDTGDAPSHQETKAPEPSGEPSKESPHPEATDKPAGNQKPEPTDKPEGTQKPEATDKPEATQKPEPTEHREPTENPNPTNNP